MRDATVAASREEHHLRVPVVCREWPAMAENDGLPLAPVLVEDLNAVLRLDFAHGALSFALGGRSCNSGRAAEIKPRAGRCASNQERASRDIVDLMPLRRFRFHQVIPPEAERLGHAPDSTAPRRPAV